MLKLNVGFNRKVGEANYGSRGAAVHLELELDSSLVGDAGKLKERIRQLFILAKESVDDELHGTTAHTEQGNGQRANGHAAHSQRRQPARKATASQVRAIFSIADRNDIALADKLRADFGVDTPDQLSIAEASSLIQELNGATNGNGQGAQR